MAAGKSNAQIAELRGTSLKATEDAIHRSCRAIGVQNMNEVNLRATAVARFLSVVGVLPDLSSAS
jgi:DNA-binding NarL/FixJ family response regulator